MWFSFGLIMTNAITIKRLGRKLRCLNQMNYVKKNSSLFFASASEYFLKFFLVIITWISFRMLIRKFIAKNCLFCTRKIIFLENIEKLLIQVGRQGWTIIKDWQRKPSGTQLKHNILMDLD